jgi:hypothetical protein
MKGTIFEAYGKFEPRLRQAGKKSFFLLEAQRHRDEDLDNYLANVDEAFSLPMDHLMYYYSAHEMSPKNEQSFNKATWAALRHAHERRRRSGRRQTAPLSLNAMPSETADHSCSGGRIRYADESLVAVYHGKLQSNFESSLII